PLAGRRNSLEKLLLPINEPSFLQVEYSLRMSLMSLLDILIGALVLFGTIVGKLLLKDCRFTQTAFLAMCQSRPISTSIKLTNLLPQTQVCWAKKGLARLAKPRICNIHHSRHKISWTYKTVGDFFICGGGLATPTLFQAPKDTSLDIAGA